MSYGSSVRSWTPETGTPTDPTGSPEHRKNHLDEVQARSGAATHQGDIRMFKCFAILYCMADDVLKQTMYWKAYKKLHNSLKWVREGCTIPVPIIVLYCIVHCINSSKLHLQGVALRSQYSDPMSEVVTLQ